LGDFGGFCTDLGVLRTSFSNFEGALGLLNALANLEELFRLGGEGLSVLQEEAFRT